MRACSPLGLGSSRCPGTDWHVQAEARAAPAAWAVAPAPTPACLPTPQDRARCDELYRQARASVEGGIAFLRDQRRRDPYGDFLPRQLYEAAFPGRQAPTFPVQ